MEDDNQDGPFAVWQMFNAPTMVLFDNLEHAADGLERLLTSILKLSGDFSEVLVPRPGSSKYPDVYYKSFNTWLIGRLFFVWSVHELDRIHETSKNAQLKILNILCTNNATFFESIHLEYFDILKKLSDYYQNNAAKPKPDQFNLENFTSENIEGLNVQLNLAPIYICIKDTKTCEHLIELTLQLICESISINSMHYDKNHKKNEEMFYIVMNMLESYSMDIKLMCIQFFSKTIEKYDRNYVEKFSTTFPDVQKEFIENMEAMILSMPMFYEKDEVGTEYVNEFNKVLLRLLHQIEINKEILLTICTVVLEIKNNRIFSQELKLFCLSLSRDLELPQECLNIQNRDGKEIEMLQEYYVINIASALLQEDGKLMENWCYKQLKCLIDSSMTVCKEKVEKFLVIFHLNRVNAAMNILLRVYLKTDGNNTHLKELFTVNDMTFFKHHICHTLINNLSILTDTSDNAKTISEISLAHALMSAKLPSYSTNMHFTCLSFQTHPNFSTKDLEFNDPTKLIILRHLLVASLVMKTKFNDEWSKRIMYLTNSLINNRNTSNLEGLIPLCPLLLLNKVFFESRLISDILMPAFLSKDPGVQKQLCKTLPVISCMSLGTYIVTLSTTNIDGQVIFSNDAFKVSIICSKCNNTDKTKLTPEEFLVKAMKDKNILHREDPKIVTTNATVAGQRALFAKFLNSKMYVDLQNGYLELIERFSNHAIFNNALASEVFNEESSNDVLKSLRPFIDNISADADVESMLKDSMLNICINMLVHSTRKSLENNDYNHQTNTLDYIKEFGLSQTEKVVLPSTKLLVYFIMHPQCTLGPKAEIYLRDICEAHSTTPNQIYHRYKKDYCRLFVDCRLHNGKDFALSLLKVVRAFGFVGYRDFISKDVHHFLPYLIPYSVKIKEVPSIIEEIASLVQCSVSDFLIERFPHVYTHIYLYESEVVSKKCFELIEKMTKLSILNLVKRHFRVILTEFLLQYCCNPEKVLNACRYLACHDPDVSTPTGSINMTTSQIADFLNPKFLGVLAYFDHKLVNSKVALSVKRKALQSFPDIMKLMGVKYLTPLRFKVLATLRSALSLVKEFPKILAAAWSGFIHNIDTMSLGPLLTNLAVSLLQQFDHAPHEINKIFIYLVCNNENLLSSHISDLFFLEDTKIAEKVKMVIKRHVKRTQPEGFQERVKWFLQHLNQDIPTIKAYAFLHLDKLLKSKRSEIHNAIFGGKNIDPVMVELIDCLLTGCKDLDTKVSLSSGACLGQLGAIEAGHLPRQYVQPDRSPFAFSINDDCFAATALMELSRAFQYEKDTMNMDCYALTIQEILKTYNISPTGDKKEVWDSFPEHMHQIMFPLLSSRYTLANPSQPKKVHPLFGSAYATSFLEWAHNWSGQLIPLIESASARSLLRAVHPSMRRDVRTLLLFLPYVLLHAVMSKTNTDYVKEEILAVIGLENFENENRSSFERSRYKLLRHIKMTPSVSSAQAEEGNQGKCSKMVYTLLDFLNRWLLEWCHTKQHPLQNENYKAISSFVQQFDKLAIARGSFHCGEFERALQYAELHAGQERGRAQQLLPLLAEIYALLDEPDSVAGILSIQRSEPSVKELILAQVVTGRLQDAALGYERLAQGRQLDRHSLQGMIDCYLGLDQPFTAYRLLSELEEDDSMIELAAEPLWRLGRFEQLDELVKKPVPSSRENWGLLMGRILLSYRSRDHEAFEQSCKDTMTRLLAQMDGETKGENALRSGYQSVLGLHIVKEVGHAEEVLRQLQKQPDNAKAGTEIIGQLLDEWRRRLSLVQSDVRTIEPLLRLRRIFLQQTQELIEPTHPLFANKLKSCIGDLWLESAKHARRAGIFQQSYMYILNAEEYHPEELFIEKSKMYWARGQQEQAFTTLKRGLEENYPEIEKLTQDQRKICAKAKLLIAKYNDETTKVDVDVNIGYYKEAVDVCKQWEKSLVCLGAYYEKVGSGEAAGGALGWSRRVYALNSYGKALQYGHKYLYQSMPRMLSIWLDVEVTASDPHIHTVLAQMTDIIKTYSERLPLYLYLTAFSQIISRICHPVKEVYLQLKAIIVKLIIAYPQHTLWMMMSVIKSSYPQRIKRCQDVFADPRLKEPQLLKLVCDITQLAEKLIELCNKPIVGSSSTTTVSSLVRTLPRLLAGENFSRIMMPFQEFCKIVLPSKAARRERLDFNIPAEPPVYIAGIEEHIAILPSLQKPRKVTLKGSDGKSYIIMLKPRDDLRKDYRLMEFTGVVNRFLQDAGGARRRRLYIRTYSVLPLNEECGLIEWVPHLLGLRPILMHIYKQKGIHTSNRELKEMMCANKDPAEKKRRIYEEQLLPRHPPVFQEWFQRVFADPYGWYQARSAYIRTTAVMSMVGYILGLGDRHGENISFDSRNGDTVHVDFNCLFNKGESFEWPERVPFRLTHNMQAAMGPLRHEGMFRKCCEAVMRVLRAQTLALMSVVGPFVYDPLVSWGRARPPDAAERTNDQALQHLLHIKQRLNGMVRTKNKQLSLSLSPEGQVEHLIVEATSVHNLSQMYIGWGPFL